ncbi:transcriptional regulator [Subtercola boreus]|uniref:Transcriptional regulator n=1 Tax=Subtercola boreus TaxID=120213 RepID=A0A3E0VQ63_9MICO|nr:helix-turn-helix domain-containing protein [Subtercola boreus]RFA11670.1 transcriptional regulator [Subtercola boreus]
MTPQSAAEVHFDAHSYNVYDPACPSRAVLEHVTSRWGVLVLAALREGTFRFSALRRRVSGVSEKMLSQTLRSLESDGFVARRDHRSVPPHVDYTLTPTGEEIATLVSQLVDWVENHVPAPQTYTAPRD